LSVDESLIIASGGMLDDLFYQIYSALEMHHLSTSSSLSDNDKDEYWSLQLTDDQFDYATEMVAIRMRYFNIDVRSMLKYNDVQSK